VTEPDPANYPWWLAGRSAGIVAFLVIAASVMLGLFLASRLSRQLGRPGLKRDLVTVHQQMTLTALVLVAVHGLCLLGDKWLKPGIVGIAVPFTISSRPLWVGMGIIGGYLAASLGLTYYARRRIGARRWRQMHRATVLVYVLAAMHSLGSGTDGASGWFTALVVVTALPILVLLVLRYWPSKAWPARARPAKAPSRDAPAAIGGAGG
jgi:sulfoxide reductase heme-binding subunit YedZ